MHSPKSHISTKQPYISAKTPYISAKEPYISAKELYNSLFEIGLSFSLSLLPTHCLSLSLSLSRSLALSLQLAVSIGQSEYEHPGTIELGNKIEHSKLNHRKPPEKLGEDGRGSHGSQKGFQKV